MYFFMPYYQTLVLPMRSVTLSIHQQTFTRKSSSMALSIEECLIHRLQPPILRVQLVSCVLIMAPATKCPSYLLSKLQFRVLKVICSIVSVLAGLVGLWHCSLLLLATAFVLSGGLFVFPSFSVARGTTLRKSQLAE